MSEDKYYVIHPTADGDVFVSEMTEEQILKDMNDDGHGHVDMPRERIHAELPKGMEAREWDCRSLSGDRNRGSYLIIKGRIVKPKVVEKVTKVELE